MKMRIFPDESKSHSGPPILFVPEVPLAANFHAPRHSGTAGICREETPASSRRHGSNQIVTPFPAQRRVSLTTEKGRKEGGRRSLARRIAVRPIFVCSELTCGQSY